MPIPANIRPNHYFQFSADNIDIIEETLDGQGTFHATQTAAFQGGKSQETCIPPIALGKERSLTVPDTLHQLTAAPWIASRPAPAFAPGSIDIAWYDADATLDRNARLWPGLLHDRHILKIQKFIFGLDLIK